MTTPPAATPPPLALPRPLPTLDQILERTRVVSLPMRARFRGITTREVALIEGPRGWGEFGPFLEYPPQEAATWLASALEAAWLGLPAPETDFVEVNATIPAVTPEEVPGLLERYPGCQTVKIKVAEPGQTLAQDRARVDAVRTARPGARVRVDANQGWSVPEAVTAAAALGWLEYLEQPCRGVDNLSKLRAELDRRGIATPIAADESIRKARDPYLVARGGAARFAVLKAAPLGGVRRLTGIAKHLAESGMSVVVASALDTAVGMNAGLVAAAAASRGAAGLATQSLFLADVAAPRRLVDGALPTTPVVPEPARLEELRAAPHREAWWRGRIAQCLRVLA